MEFVWVQDTNSGDPINCCCWIHFTQIQEKFENMKLIKEINNFIFNR
jgi:hypothetical protein